MKTRFTIFLFTILTCFGFGVSAQSTHGTDDVQTTYLRIDNLDECKSEDELKPINEYYSELLNSPYTISTKGIHTSDAKTFCMRIKHLDMNNIEPMPGSFDLKEKQNWISSTPYPVVE